MKFSVHVDGTIFALRSLCLYDDGCDDHLDDHIFCYTVAVLKREK